MISPTRDEFKQRARHGNTVAVTRDVLADMLTPVSAFRRLAAGDVPSFLLESVERGDQMGRYSFLGANPILTLRAKGGVVTLTENGATETISLTGGRDALSVLEEVMGRYQWVGGPDLPPFVGGAVGLMTSDIVRFFEELPDTVDDDLAVPDALFVVAETIVIFDHLRHHIKVLCNARVGDDTDAAYDAAVAAVEGAVACLQSPDVPQWLPVGDAPQPPEWNMTAEAYLDMVRQGVE
jgi:anthranilate synthase component 1